MSENLPAVPGDVPEEPARATYEDVTKRGERKPLVAEQWQRHNLRHTIRQLAGLHWHKAKWHALRLHIHVPKIVFYAVRGAWRLLVRLLRWWHAADLYEVKYTAIAAGRAAHKDAVRVHDEIEKTRQRRGQYLLAWAVPVVAGVLAMTVWAPWWCWPLPLLGLGRFLVHHGKPEGKPAVEAAVLAPEIQPPTKASITDALSVLGISPLAKAIADGWDGFIAPGVGRAGRGWLVMLDLPPGVTVEDVAKERDRLAAALRRPLACVWAEGDQSEHPGRLVLYICDESLNKVRQPAWPLATAAKASMFDPIPFGFDERLRPVSLTLMFANLLVGSISRMGKTQAVRNVLLAAALDPLCELHVWEFKGTGDLRSLAKVAVAYGSGPDDETIAGCLADLRQVHAELARRAKVIAGLPLEQCPQQKVTPQLAARRSLRLHPVVFAVSECQEAFINATVKAEFEELCLQVIRRGPALGIMLILETQRPDAKALPPAICANVAMRFCLKVMDQTANDMVLGTSAYRRGINATQFAFEDKGIGWGVGIGPEPQIIKTFDIDGPAAEQISVRARAAREAAGTLTVPAGDAPAARDVLADVLAVMGGESSIHWPVLAERLAAKFPDRWAGASADAVSAQCRSHGVPSRAVTRQQKTLQGCYLAAVKAAVSREQ